MQREADIANNRGIAFEARLQTVPLDASANTRGIKRAADKARGTHVCVAHLVTHDTFSTGFRQQARNQTTWPLQVLLPASVGASLLQQDAMVAGTPFFELRTASGARTHVGVLDYSAAEGTVALPLQVIRSLWGPDATLDAATGLLHVKFVRLNKGMPCVRST